MAVNAVTPCYRCSYCQRGFTSQCGGALGGYKYTVQMDGNMAEYFVVPAAQANLTPIPDDLTDEQAVYTCDMLSTGFMGAEHAYLQFGETVAVFAQGPVGLCATMGANLLGAGGSSRSSRGLSARRWPSSSAPTTSSTSPQGDPVEQIMDLTGGEGVDAAIEAFGFPQTFEACLRVTKAGGRVSNIGYHGENPAPLQLPLDAFGLGMNDKAIHTGLCPGGNERMSRLFRLMLSGRIDPTPMTTHTFKFDDVDRGVRDDDDEGRRHHQAADHVRLIAFPAWPRPLPTAEDKLRVVRPVVELQSISKVYGGADVVVRAVDGVDLVVERGDYLAVMGASGSGKSTLMNIIGCLDAATSGATSSTASTRSGSTSGARRSSATARSGSSSSRST